MKKTHKEKVKMARKMCTKKEAIAKVPIFQTSAWDKRKQAIKKRVTKAPVEVWTWEEVKPEKKSLFTKVKEWIWKKTK